MTKRLPPKGRQPWPAFILVTILLAATALISALLLDFIAMRKGERSYIFVTRERPSVSPPGEEPGPKPGIKPFEEVLAASLTAAGVSEDVVLRTKGPEGRPLFEVEIPAELYASVEPALEKALKGESVRVLSKKRTAGEERAEVLWALRRPAKEDAGIAFILPAEPSALSAAK
jgi:hypothetical protein